MVERSDLRANIIEYFLVEIDCKRTDIGELYEILIDFPDNTNF